MDPFAAFDVLSILDRLRERELGAPQIHLFAYLACLLSLYEGNPAALWEYGFAATREGAPYSREIQTAIDGLTQVGDIVSRGDSLTLAEDARAELTVLRTLLVNARRERFIDGACSTVLSIPLGLIRHALLREPDLKAGTAAHGVRGLLDEPSCQLLYEHFEALSSAVGETSDLMVPAVVWLNYLISTSGQSPLPKR